MGAEIGDDVELLPLELAELCINAAELANERANAAAAERLRERGVALLDTPGIESADKVDLYMRAADLARAGNAAAREIELRSAALSAHQVDAGADDPSSYRYQEELAGAMDRAGRGGDGASLRATAGANANRARERAMAGRSAQYDWATSEHARLLYVTTRRRTPQGAHRSSAAQGPARFGEAFVTIPRFQARSTEDRATDASSRDPSRRITFQDETPFSSRQQFLNELRRSTTPPQGGEVLVFIHGYNTSFTSAVTRAAELGALLEINGAVVVFSWPSAGRLLSYVDDGNAAENAANINALTQLLRDVVAQNETRRVYVIAHSMGNRFLVRALGRLVQETPQNGRAALFDEVVFASPDVRRSEFRETIPNVNHLATRMTIYASDRDRALKISSFLHFADRVGVATPPVSMPETETINTTGVSFGSFGHDDFSSSARDDLRGVVWQSQQPSRRCVLANSGTARVWVFRPPANCAPMAYRAALWYQRHFPETALYELDRTIARLEQSGAAADRVAYHRSARALLQSWD